MATQEKLLKSLESLRSLINSNLSTNISRKKEKIQHCSVITEAMANSTIRIAPNFGHLLGFSIEVLLQLCDDPESDVRMVVDECLNRLIRVMSNGNMSKIQIELHKEIKKNGAERSLRAALWRFAELAGYIRPHKGKPYVANLMPCIIKVTERKEEMVHETLSNSFPKIIAALGCFTTDNDIKGLLKAFLNNISSNSAVIRRTTANCILSTCLNCRKPYVFITYILNNLLDTLIPIQDSHTSYLVLGVMGCLKNILPHIKNSDGDQEIKGSFGVCKEINENPLAVDRLLQVYELCLHYILDNNHNIINASLETLIVLLQNAPSDLISVLVSPNGITKSRISFYESKLKQRSPSQLSVATTCLSGEDGLETELMDSLRPDIEKWIDESKLSVFNITYARTNDVPIKQVTNDSVDHVTRIESAHSLEYSNMTIGTITGDGVESIKGNNPSITDNLDKLMLSETSSEQSFTQCTEEKSLVSTKTDVVYQEIDVGDFRDKDFPLNFCTRLITKSFLLTGYPNTLIPDKSVRVSVKSLSLTCLATIFQVCPKILLKYLDKAQCKDMTSKQRMSDVLLFKDHVDPQLRGVVRILIGNFLKAVLMESGGDYDGWIAANNTDDNDSFHIENLIDCILKGLEDESSNCSKQSLLCLGVCLKHILESQISSAAIPVLNYLPIMVKNPYWLVKVTLMEVVANLQYVTIYHVSGSLEFQDKVVFNIFFEMLKDDNQRVRSACSSAIVQIIPLLYYKQHIPNENTITRKAKYFKNLYLSNLFDLNLETNLNKKHFIRNLPFPFNGCCDIPNDTINQAISRIISKLYKILLTSTSKYFIFGCVETLCLLSNAYPPTVYSNAWSCFKNFQISKEQNTSPVNKTLNKELTLSSSMGLFNVCISLLCNGNVAYDLNCHLYLLKLAGNLFAGVSIQNLKPKTDLTLEDTNQFWDMFTDKNLSTLTEQFFNHILKLLNIFCHVLDEMIPTQPQAKPVLPNLPTPSTLSPIKRRKSDLGERTKVVSPGKVFEKDDKSERKENAKFNLIGYFASIPHYLKIYDLLRTAYCNYKTTLDSEASEKFLELLKITLQTLSQLLELATLFESGRIAEEILNYFRCIFNLEPSSTVECVQQLLKSLFGSNITCNAAEILNISNKQNEDENGDGLFYHSVFQQPYNDMLECINSFHNSNKIDHDGDSTVMGYLHRKESTKSAILPRGADKILANYIRLFEPMVIKSLKQYTITSDIKLQCRVLQLLCQLVHLRVNYCLLDSEQIFIGFVIKQFEYIEEGQIPYSVDLIPRIFNFLVHLSYGKQHSKSIIGVPKIIQLCDGLMASGQPPLTHCIPALEPVVEDIFLYRNKANTTDFKELETTREVLLSMLLRWLEYSEVVDLLILILNDSKYCIDNTDKWIRWSKQVSDVFLPMLKQNKIPINNRTALTAIRKLAFILNPSVFKPLNDVLINFFDIAACQGSSLIQINRWLGKILTLFLIISQAKEEMLLLKITEIQLDLTPRCIFRNIPTTADPLNVTNTAEFLNGIQPEAIFVRFLFRVIDIVVDKCVEILNAEDNMFLIEELSSLLMFCLHIFQSGSHCKLANIAIKLANYDCQVVRNEENLPIEDINRNIIKLSPFFPTLSFQWCYLLTLLNYNSREFWSTTIQISDKFHKENPMTQTSIQPKSNCINLEIVRVGATVLFCDYLNENMTDEEQQSWFLVNNIELLVRLCEEEPVCEFFSSLHRNSSNSGLVIEAISTKCLPNAEPTFKTKILKVIENVHSSRVGSLLCVLLPKLLDCRQLALSRLVANLASRKIELLLTMSMEEVNNQLPKDDLIRIMDQLTRRKLIKKHETLVSLLNKLATQFYDLSPLEFDQRRTVNPLYVKKLQINKAWFISQVKCKSHSFGVGPELSELLSCLEYDDVYNIMSSKNFNKLILKDCIAWGMNKIKESSLRKEPVLLKASISVLINKIDDIIRVLPKLHQVYKVIGRIDMPKEINYSNQLSELFSDDLFWSNIYDIIPSVAYYVQSLPSYTNLTIPENNIESFTKFSVLCLESANYIISVDKNNINVNCLDMSVNCVKAILRNACLSEILGRDSHASWLCSSVNSIYKLVFYFLLGNEPLPDVSKYGLANTLGNLDTVAAGHACHQLSVLISWLEKTQNSIFDIPKFILDSIISIILSLCRLPLVNSYLLTPPSAWRSGLKLKLTGSFNTHVPSLPIEFLQEVDILEEFIYRITLLGWTSRLQFEETWMCLLSVLSSSPTEESIPEEVNTITHVTSLAVQAITALLLQTLCSPIVGDTNVSKFLHVSRDVQIDEKSTSITKLKNVHNKLQHKFNQHSMALKSNSVLINVFDKPNLEKLVENYSFGQLSIEYLLISARSVEIVDENRIAAKVYEARQQILDESGLDLNSCIQFLIDLYSQWIKAQNTPLRILYEVVKSILVISDLFTDKSQFVWMLEIFLDLTKSHTIEDEVLQQYLVIGVCKASAILTPDIETYESVKKLIVQNLKSGFLPSKIASLHGLLYLLQGSFLGNTRIGGISEEMQLIFPVAVEYVQCYISLNNGVLIHSPEHSLLVWAIAFYLIENIEENNFVPDFVSTVVQAAIVNISQQKVSAVHNAILKGLERLVIIRSISGKMTDQLVKLSLDKIKNGSPAVVLPAVQMLLSCIYIGSSKQLETPEQATSAVQSIPDDLVQTIEKISAIFDRIKKGYPFEVEILCSVLPDILKDFFPPSDILTKVLGEFLSPQQPHPKLLSRVVFKVFQSAIEQSQLSLLQDWVVFSLSNFTQSFSIGMATWCLTCFFISASTNNWLRSFFPYVQSRIGRYEYEDRNMLCIAGADFYKNLTNDKQKEAFVDTFTKVKDQADMPFSDLLASL